MMCNYANCLCVSSLPGMSLPAVEVYNCKVGSSDCSQCWGREDQGHLCGWCENSCKLRDDCPPMVEHCPSPEIHKVRSHSENEFGFVLHLHSGVCTLHLPSIHSKSWGHSHGLVAPVALLCRPSSWESVEIEPRRRRPLTSNKSGLALLNHNPRGTNESQSAMGTPSVCFMWINSLQRFLCQQFAQNIA